MSGWTEHFSEIFCSTKFFCKESNDKLGTCQYFESINNPTEVVNMFASVTIRIFLNLSKEILLRNVAPNSIFYHYLAEKTSEIFNFVCANVNMGYACVAFDDFKPYIDYNASSLKIVNCQYFHYIKRREKKAKV